MAFYPAEMASQTLREGPNESLPKGINHLLFTGSHFSEKSKEILILLKYDGWNKTDCFEASKLMYRPVKSAFIVFSEA